MTRECPTCSAPLREDGACPWDRGEGCRARALSVVYTPPRKPRVVAERAPRPKAPRKSRAATTPRKRRPPMTDEERREYFRAATRRWRARERAKKLPVMSTCAQCGDEFEVQGSRPISGAKFCDSICVSRYWSRKERKARAA